MRAGLSPVKPAVRETQFGYHIIKLAEIKPEGLCRMLKSGPVSQFVKQQKVKTELDSYSQAGKIGKIEKIK